MADSHNAAHVKSLQQIATCGTYAPALTATDAAAVLAELAQLRGRVRLLTRGLLHYAKGNHYVGFEKWDEPDEPNWLCAPMDEPITPADAESMMIENGGWAATVLRRAFGRVLSRYQTCVSRGLKPHQVCAEHRYPTPCPRCASLAATQRRESRPEGQGL